MFPGRTRRACHGRGRASASPGRPVRGLAPGRCPQGPGESPSGPRGSFCAGPVGGRMASRRTRRFVFYIKDRGHRFGFRNLRSYESGRPGPPPSERGTLSGGTADLGPPEAVRQRAGWRGRRRPEEKKEKPLYVREHTACRSGDGPANQVRVRLPCRNPRSYETASGRVRARAPRVAGRCPGLFSHRGGTDCTGPRNRAVTCDSFSF